MIAPAQALPLPALRSDLSLLAGAPARTGQQRWLIHDPLQQRYTQIEDTAYRLLTLWPRCKTAKDLTDAMQAQYDVAVDDAEIDAFATFLKTNHLTASTDWRKLHAANQQRHSILWRALHGYLFFRVPLLRPDRFLQATFPSVSFLFTRTTFAVILSIAAAGLYLVSRQWDAFVTTFSYMFSFEGVIAFGATLVLIKLAHELGHAYMAVRFGCHVPTMGIAFVVLTPMPYTDVTDAWKLTDRRKRLLIDSAGMMVEVAVAVIATLLWSFLPDGPLRSMAFMLATVGWIMSLAVNLNPFMRFDGYYLMSELTGIENLQARAFAFGRWKLREILFRLGFPSPEQLPGAMQKLLIAYAWLTWIYRLVLFLGIALFVYHYFFKALGIALFLVEIVYFIAYPIASEMAAWRQLCKPILASRRTRLTGLILFLGLAVLIIPWSRTIHVPALLEAQETSQLHAPTPAYVEEVNVRQGQDVTAGQVIVRLRSPAIDQAIKETRIQIELNSLRLSRRAGDDLDLEDSIVLQHERTALQKRLAGLIEESNRFHIKARSDGRVLEFANGLHPGRWVGPREQLALIGSPHGVSARGYIAERDLWRVQSDSQAVFIPEMPVRLAVPLQLHQVSTAGVAAIDLAELSSTHGGAVPVVENAERRLVPKSGEFLAVFHAVSSLDGHAPDKAIRGLIHMRGQSESIASGIWRGVLKVLVRESGV